MLKQVFVILLALVFFVYGQGIGGYPPNDFDLYCLAQTWAPQFCCGSAGSGEDQCKNIDNSWGATHFTLHGLWPQFAEAREIGGREYRWPQYCHPYRKCGSRNPPSSLVR